MKYKDTNEMLADILTKPLSKSSIDRKRGLKVPDTLKLSLNIFGILSTFLMYLEVLIQMYLETISYNV